MKRTVTGAAEVGVPVTLFQMLCRRWHWPAVHLSETYRPERHYMRGPGPKSREKHAAVDARS